MGIFTLTYKRFSERCILVEWPEEISSKIIFDVLHFKDSIEKSNIEPIIDINNAYNSLLITYNFTIEDFNSTFETLKSLYDQIDQAKFQKSFHWKIPVCYDAKFGWDLPRISESKNLTIDMLIKLHSEATYLVHFIGFLPGFLYLGGLNSKLQMPRLDHPREKVEKGAVGIAFNQTGIYPNDSPGGWNIIGNCPISMFNRSKNPPCFIKAGDTISFRSITLEEHANIRSEDQHHNFNLKSLLGHD